MIPSLQTGKQGTERLSNLPSVSQLVSGGAGNSKRSSLAYNHYTIPNVLGSAEVVGHSLENTHTHTHPYNVEFRAGVKSRPPCPVCRPLPYLLCSQSLSGGVRTALQGA